MGILFVDSDVCLDLIACEVSLAVSITCSTVFMRTA
jgi:hypothetical protein